MSLLSDKEIRKLSKEQNMIENFEEHTTGGVSYGLSSYGYDSRLQPKLLVFKQFHETIIDPKNFDPNCYEELKGDTFIIPPHGFALGYTFEKFKVPKDVLVICLGKSTYARCGLIVNVTPLEPGWEGYVTLEFSNTTPLPIKIYANEGICQFLFFKGNEQCETTYDQRKGKYMNQKDITLPFVIK